MFTFASGEGPLKLNSASLELQCDGTVKICAGVAAYIFVPAINQVGLHVSARGS